MPPERAVKLSRTVFSTFKDGPLRGIVVEDMSAPIDPEREEIRTECVLTTPRLFLAMPSIPVTSM